MKLTARHLAIAVSTLFIALFPTMSLADEPTTPDTPSTVATPDTPATPDPISPGWQHDGDTVRYLHEDGSYATGWLWLSGTWYYLSPTSAELLRGWNFIDGQWYWLSPEDGAMTTWWAQPGLPDDETWYFFGTDGAMRRGWQLIDGRWFCLGPDGAMHTGWELYAGSWYYLSPSSGTMMKEWLLADGAWFYLGFDGAMQSGWQRIGGTWYYLNEAHDGSFGQWLERTARAGQLRGELNLTEIYYPEFSHGVKTAQFQKYIVLHDTEGSGTPQIVLDGWLARGEGVATHFVVGKDGSVLQCVPLDAIAHHAGSGTTGNNAVFGTWNDPRDDAWGYPPVSEYLQDKGMNAFSIGIEMIHIGGEGYYPEAQLEAVDRLIAYIDAYYGFESRIIDHKMWAYGNSDTSPEFAGYLANYMSMRRHA